jgi:Zn-dependent protease
LFARNITLLTFRGISVRLHWTFILFLVWIALSNPGNLSDKASELFFLLSIFTCVVLHEYGHALTARLFGINTRDITLYPIGGVALLVRDPKPKEEFFIALAGPLVNVVIAILIFNFYGIDESALISEHASFWTRIFVANLVLVVFNMIPAYPMDGGRVLRSALGLILAQGSATIISARIGQLFSILMAGLAIYFDHTILLIIAFFIFMQARRDILFWKQRAAMEEPFSDNYSRRSE